ncbi:MAG: BspA family leucine-rich repeat surface protein, partial [Pseudomonadota bacterium]|nr:BspA family leucine-rich repeat surface protein [Pseudomonadota bacterium]
MQTTQLVIILALYALGVGCDMGSTPRRNTYDTEPEPFTAAETVASAHVSKWRVAKGEMITLPIVPAVGNNFSVDWGDGEVETFTNQLATHTYAQRGVYTVKIAGVAQRWSFFALPDSRQQILAVSDFGDLGWQQLDGAFWQTDNLTHVAGGEVGAVSSMRLAFAQAINAEVDIANWDTSNVVDMRAMFDTALAANPDVSNWDTGAVIDMAAMFTEARSAQPDVSAWDVSAVEDMRAMFSFAIIANP